MKTIDSEEFYDALDTPQEKTEETKNDNTDVELEEEENEEFYEALDTIQEENKDNNVDNKIINKDNDNPFAKIDSMKIQEGLTGYAYNYIYTAVEKKTEKIIEKYENQFCKDVGYIIRKNIMHNGDWENIDIGEIKSFRNRLDMLCYGMKKAKKNKLDEWKRMYETRKTLSTNEEIKEGKKQRAEFLINNEMKLKDLHLKSFKTGLDDLYLLVSLKIKRLLNFNYVKNSNKVIKEIFSIEQKLELLNGVLYMKDPTDEYNEMINRNFELNKKYLALVKGICIDESDIKDFEWNKFNEFITKGITSEYDLEKFKMLNIINKSAISEFKEIGKYLDEEIEKRGKLKDEELRQYKQEVKEREQEKKRKEKEVRKKKELSKEDKIALKAYKKLQRENYRKKMGIIDKILDTVREVLFINKLIDIIGHKISVLIAGEENFEKVQKLQIEKGKEILKNLDVKKTVKIDIDEINENVKEESKTVVENEIKERQNLNIVMQEENVKEETNINRKW